VTRRERAAMTWGIVIGQLVMLAMFAAGWMIADPDPRWTAVALALIGTALAAVVGCRTPRVRSDNGEGPAG
jgi:hypothetical protein